MKNILFMMGLFLLGGLYLHFVETWRIGCLIMWVVIPFYIVGGYHLLRN